MCYFNPHSRKGSDGEDTDNSKYYSISIHTPARGVTKHSVGFQRRAHNFNPHSRKGSDLGIFVPPYVSRISIHTPARGVTSCHL